MYRIWPIQEDTLQSGLKVPCLCIHIVHIRKVGYDKHCSIQEGGVLVLLGNNLKLAKVRTGIYLPASVTNCLGVSVVS
jgi:hypothetical protein